MADFPKFQVDITIGGEMYHVRCDNIDDFVSSVAALKSEYHLDEQQSANETQEQPQPSQVCQTCGKPAKHAQGTSKAGKQYNAIFCSSGNKSHTQWL